jgi:hypothetical protein
MPAILYSFILQVDEAGRSSCPIASCRLTPLSDFVVKFAHNNAEWVRVFTVAFSKFQVGSPPTKKIRKSLKVIQAKAKTFTFSQATSRPLPSKISFYSVQFFPYAFHGLIFIFEMISNVIMTILQ